ncbi:MAG: MMPL family transporter [Hyphomicrobiales bacterium]|nr:MMPL family transporter [Hyphomicrobiales bacterium]
MSAGFGLEKLGHLTLGFPRATLVAVAMFMAVFVYGSSQLGFSSDIREIFRSGSADFVTLEEVTRQYPGNDRDILIVVEGSELFQTATLEKLRELHLELSFVEGVGSVLSIFSARQPPDEKGQAASLFPTEMAEISDLKVLQKDVQNHPLVSGRLLSRDGDLTLIVLSLAGQQHDVDKLRAMIGEVKKTANTFLKGTDLRFTLTGSAVMRVEIIGALIRDQKRFRVIGLAVSAILCWLFFRSFAYVTIALAPAGLAIVGLRGGMALVGQEINVLTNVIPGLVLVVAFASALHLLFAIRRKLGQGLGIEEAIGDSVDKVGPACVLTAATTTIALLSLTVVPHRFITSFGLTAALGTAFTYVAIMVTVPPLSRLLLAKTGQQKTGWGSAEPIHRFFGNISAVAARWVRNAPGLIAAIGIVVAIVAASLYTLNKPQYQYQDNLPAGNPAFRAIETINSKLSGTDTLKLLIQWPAGHTLKSTKTLDVVRDAHQILQSEPEIRLATSLRDIEEWYVEGGRDRAQLFAFLDKSATPLVSRVISTDHNSTILLGYFGGLQAAELVSLMDRLEKKLDGLAERHGPVKFALTGLVPVSAKASTEMIGQLNTSLLVAIAMIILLIGLAYRSLVAGLVSILPNVLPIAIAGAALYLFGRGLQFTSVVGFTIGFGIAVDSTIHVLNRYRLEKQGNGPTADALDQTIIAIGPVLLVSTLVLVAGIGGTMFSELPMVRLYGQVISLLLSTALVGALVFLPAIIRLVDDWLRAEIPQEKGAKRRAKSRRRKTQSK